MGKKEQVGKKTPQKVEEESDFDYGSSNSSDEPLKNLSSDKGIKQSGHDSRTKNLGSNKRQKTRPILKAITKSEKLKLKREHQELKKIEQDQSSSQDEQIQHFKEEPKIKFKKQQIKHESDDNSDQEMVDEGEQQEDASSISSEAQEDAQDQSENISSISSEQTPDYESQTKGGKVKKEQSQDQDLVEQNKKLDSKLESSRIGLSSLDTLVNEVTNIRLILERMESFIILRNGIPTPENGTPVVIQPSPRQVPTDLPPPSKQAREELIKIEALQFKQQPQQEGNNLVAESDQNRYVDLKEREKKKKKKLTRSNDDRITIE